MGHTPSPEHADTQPRRRHVWDESERTKRQAALGIETHGDNLKQDEVEQLERFQALEPEVPLRDTIEWIPQNGDPPGGNDIRWHARGGIEFEMKTCSAKYKSIADAIRKAVKKSKQRFLVDIRNKPLGSILRHQLESYNLRNPNNQIKELWVMGAGRLEQIFLTGQG